MNRFVSFRNRQYWKSILTGIRKEAYEKARPEATKEMPFNVIMFGFDSLSRNAWMRKLPKTYDYMTNQLNADVLQSYNIVGDGTPQALIPVSFTLSNDFLSHSYFSWKWITYWTCLVLAAHWIYGTGTARDAQAYIWIGFCELVSNDIQWICPTWIRDCI